MISIINAQESMRSRGREVEQYVRKERPELLDLFFTYQNEAIAARSFLDKNLKELNDGVEILEVGGGILALAVQLASEGYKITTVEPVGGGFGGIPFMMQKCLKSAQDENLTIKLVSLPIEQCKFDQKFNFVFSINVMEHLTDPYSVLAQLVGYLTAKGKYRFFCPNYDFLYEPHFGKWLVLRRWGGFYLSKKSACRRDISNTNTSNLYESINF